MRGFYAPLEHLKTGLVVSRHATSQPGRGSSHLSDSAASIATMRSMVVAPFGKKALSTMATEAYVKQHKLEKTLEDMLNSLKSQPDNPYSAMVRLLPPATSHVVQHATTRDDHGRSPPIRGVWLCMAGLRRGRLRLCACTGTHACVYPSGSHSPYPRRCRHCCRPHRPSTSPPRSWATPPPRIREERRRARS